MYKLHIPAPLAHVEAECRIAEKHFHDARPADDVDQIIFQRNPYQVVTVTDAANEVLAYADLFVLTPQRYDDLVSDRITEDHLTTACFMPWPEAAGTTSIYLAGIAVDDLSHPDRSLIANALLYGCLRLMEKYYLVPGKMLGCSMIAFSPGGARIADKLNFVQQGTHQHGILYTKDMNLDIIHTLYAVLPPLAPAFTVVE